MLMDPTLAAIADSFCPNARQTGGMSETTGRVLQLLGLLQSRRVWSGDELAERLGRDHPQRAPRRRTAA